MQTIKQSDQGFWLFTQGSNIYLIENQLPKGQAESFGLVGEQALNIGIWQNEIIWLVSASENLTNEHLFFKQGGDFYSLRSQLAATVEYFNLLNRGVSLNHYFQTHKFCGKCGSPTQVAVNEWAVQCSNIDCGYRGYPVICPCIIVAVRRGQEILLANHVRHKSPTGGMYTALAGFVEVGETFEQTVEREIFEEVGLKVKNIRYFGSQPWAFPNSQMVGFLADYESGEIQLQEAEIADAKWFHYQGPLPQLPPQGTIALKLIQATLTLCQQADRN